MTNTVVRARIDERTKDARNDNRYVVRKRLGLIV